MKKIAIFTTTRAEFGLYTPLLNAISNDKDLTYKLFVGGAHLADKQGRTISEIQDFGFKIDSTFDYTLNSTSSVSIAKSLGIEMYELAAIFNDVEFDFVCILGDRYELLPIVQNAIIFKKPIIHLYGGEKTEGAIDEQIRHMITKAAHLHFVACEEYKKNVRQMGESDWRIFNFGSLATDNIKKNNKIPKTQLFGELGLSNTKLIILFTYHPVTLENEISIEDQLINIFTALSQYDLQVVITAPNNDVDGDKIDKLIMKNIQNKEDYHYIRSLGVKRYHSLISQSKFVIGNSSSGITEVPYFKVPTINIGDRQKGRIRHESVIDVGYSTDSILRGIEKALNEEFRKSLDSMKYKFGDGNAAIKMVSIIKKICIDKKLLRKELDFPDCCNE